MKRFFCLMMCICLLFLVPLNVSADVCRIEEDFTIRNGITFRMKKDDIIKAETDYGTNLSESKMQALYVLDKTNPDRLSTKRAYTFSGIPFFRNIDKDKHPQARLLYFLSDDSELMEMCYWELGDNMLYNSTDAKNDYNIALEKLISKYGKPVGRIIDGNGTLFAGHSFSYNAAFQYPGYYDESKFLDRLIAEVESVIDCAQWIVEYEDCVCLIELFLRKGVGLPSKSGFVGPLVLAYRLFDYNEFQEFTETTEDEVKQATRDY